jgi:hypothetical protein
LVIAIAAFLFKANDLGILLLVITAFLFAARKWMQVSANKLRCEPPPKEPTPERGLLHSKPKLVFYLSSNRAGSTEFDEYDGYPPDWEERKAFCLARDNHRCRICGNSENLHVHHVFPVSYSSNHTIQNLITLCRSCHMKQDYWNHKQLVTENIHANKKICVGGYIKSDGVIVGENRRKTGRRGNFWKKVKNERLQHHKPKQTRT